MYKDFSPRGEEDPGSPSECHELWENFLCSAGPSQQTKRQHALFRQKLQQRTNKHRFLKGTKIGSNRAGPSREMQELESYCLWDLSPPPLPIPPFISISERDRPPCTCTEPVKAGLNSSPCIMEGLGNPAWGIGCQMPCFGVMQIFVYSCINHSSSSVSWFSRRKHQRFGLQIFRYSLRAPQGLKKTSGCFGNGRKRIFRTSSCFKYNTLLVCDQVVLYYYKPQNH